jgi:transaldolase
MPAPPTKTRLLLDGGDAAETRRVRDLLGRLDGQTTNPTLVAANPEIRDRLTRGNKLARREALEFYRDLVRQIAMVTSGPISIEVYADHSTTSGEMLDQAAEMWSWIPNAVIKLPTTAPGLAAAQQAAKDGVRLNLTLCFSEAQAAAVYQATRGARASVFVSPFVGRLDDRGENGMQLIANILDLYRAGDGHVEVLTASVRHLDHLLEALRLGSPLVTVPARVYEEWARQGYPLPGADYRYPASALRPIPARRPALDQPLDTYDIRHDLTDTGLRKFAENWNDLLMEPMGGRRGGPRSG